MKTTVWVLALVSCLAGCQPKADVMVECRGLKKDTDGVACTVEHRGGNQPIRACWTFQMSCTNGILVSADACGDVLPKGTIQKMMPYSLFKDGMAGCSHVADTRLVNIRASYR
jgi:hypothetical protein